MMSSTFEAGAKRQRALGRSMGSLALLAILAALLLAASGCSGSDCAGIPQDGAVRVSQQAAQRLQVRLDQVNASQAPEFTLEATDEEVTSYLAVYLKQSPLTDAQVRFLSGKVQIYAAAAQLLNLSIASLWTAQVEAGQVHINLESATVSCMPVPPQLLESISATLNQMIVESQVNIQVKAIRLEPGKVSVTASKTK
jgi:uncharacterized protein YpmS